MIDNNKKKITPKRRRPDDNAQRMAYLNKMKKREEEQSLFVRVFVGMLVLFMLLFGGILLLSGNSDFVVDLFGQDSAITKFVLKVTQGNANKQHAEFNWPFGPRRQNILLLGVDASDNPNDLWTGTRTDTIILVNIDPKTKSVNAVSVPRDSKVYLPEGHGIQKINAAHAIGGVGMTIKTVEQTLGVKVDRYIMVHDDAVKAIVEALGGVDVYVEKPMHYDDYAGKLHINLSKGVHRLSPTEAVGYLRFRHDALGDIGRTRRQQWFMRGLLDELQKPETITKIPDIISVTNKYVKTNMSIYELSQYAGMAKHIDMDKIEIAMLPGAPNKKGHISYWILDPEKSQEVINRLIYREKIQPEEGAVMTAGIMYSQDSAQKAQDVKSELEAVGVNVSCTGHISRIHTQFIAHSVGVTNEYYNFLKKKVPSIDKFQFVYEPSNYFCGSTDFTVIVADN